MVSVYLARDSADRAWTQQKHEQLRGDSCTLSTARRFGRRIKKPRENRSFAGFC